MTSSGIVREGIESALLGDELSQALAPQNGFIAYTTRYDKTSTALTEYFGFAPCGTATSVALWTIKKIVTDANGNIVATWANAGLPNQVWDDRTSLTYT